MSQSLQTVVAYDPAWPEHFNLIKQRVLPIIVELITGFEHIGSTAVEGLAAKPVIDIDAIYSDKAMLPEIVRRLEKLGYVHEGDKGIPDREAFKAPPGTRHHLYVCKEGCLALRNHLAVRDYFRSNSEERDSYGSLKLELAPLYEKAPAEYVEAKTEFLKKILSNCGINAEEISNIAEANLAKKS
jgi:GrpB-like predicted nucleotidyltransferase (UPF0157 family)